MELEDVDRITAGAIGEPGARTFFIQARQGDELATVLVEKEQVQLLAASVLEVLSRLDVETGTDGPSEEEMALEEPFEPLWRAGRLSIGYDESRDRLLLEMEQLLPEREDEDTEDDEDDEDAEQPDRVRVWATREQMLSLSRHGALVCQKGRPPCELCGNPKDPEGHACPATNGHRKLGSS
jgi:uncharacterized repeat protein (TIGR03847 family)